MSNRCLKKSLSDKSNRPLDLNDADENLDLFSVNHRGLTSLDVLLKPGRRSFEQAKAAKPEADDVKKHENDPLSTVPEVPLETLSRLVLEVRNASLKLQSITNKKAASKSESDPLSRPTRSGSTIRPSNIPTLRSSSAPKKTTTASSSSPKRSISRSLTPVSRKTPSRSSTPSRIVSTTTSSTTPCFKNAGDTQRSRSLTPRSKPLIAENTSALPSIKTKVRSASVSSSISATPQTPPRVKGKVTLAFGRPVTTTGNVNSPKRNTSPDVRPKARSASPSLIPTFSGVSHTATTLKPVSPSADSTRSGRKLSKTSDAREGKAGTNPFLGTMLYPHSIRSSSTAIRKRYGSEATSSSSNQEEEEGKSLTKEAKTDSGRYDALLNVNDVKDTNWLLNVEDESHYSLIFDNAFDSPPEPFSPL